MRGLALVLVLLSAGCTVTLFKKDPTLGIVETLAKAQATPTPFPPGCVTIEGGAIACPVAGVSK